MNEYPIYIWILIWLIFIGAIMIGSIITHQPVWVVLISFVLYALSTSTPKKNKKK